MRIIRRSLFASPVLSFLPVLIACLAMLTASCGRQTENEPAVATPSVTLSKDKVPIDSVLTITYKFIVAPNATFDKDYWVFMHVLDPEGEQLWTEDHQPPTPTTQWKPGQTIEYTRTEFIPVFPYVGEASIQVGLYSTSTQKRVTLTGEDAGQKAYKVARLQLQPQTENVYTVFKDGWQPAEQAEHNATVEWQWTKKDATLVFKNPKKDVVFYLDVDNPGSVFKEPQQVQVLIGGQAVDSFTLTPGQPLLRKVPIKAAQLGTDDMVELHLAVDKSFVPSLMPASNSKDPRELGIRVFHAYIDPR